MLKLWRLAGLGQRLAAVRFQGTCATGGQGNRSIKLKIRPYREICVGDHDEHNARIGRPLSPHLSIYRPEATSMLSIIHRVSGTVVAGYVTIFALTHGLFDNYDALLCFLDNNLSNTTHTLMKLAIAAPFAYHYCNGVRHLAWDTGRFFSMPEVNTTGAVMFGCFLVVLGIIMSL